MMSSCFDLPKCAGPSGVGVLADEQPYSLRLAGSTIRSG